MAGVIALGYTAPTPIQVQAIPPVLEGRDVMGLAQTGTGKTAAFVLPILQRLLPGPRDGVDIVVACPGRLLDHINQRTINLSHLEVLVLDEADRMFDMGFLPDIRKILKHLPAHRQTLLFSATMPDDIKHLA